MFLRPDSRKATFSGNARISCARNHTRNRESYQFEAGISRFKLVPLSISSVLSSARYGRSKKMLFFANSTLRTIPLTHRDIHKLPVRRRATQLLGHRLHDRRRVRAREENEEEGRRRVALLVRGLHVEGRLLHVIVALVWCVIKISGSNLR